MVVTHRRHSWLSWGRKVSDALWYIELVHVCFVYYFYFLRFIKQHTFRGGTTLNFVTWMGNEPTNIRLGSTTFQAGHRGSLWVYERKEIATGCRSYTVSSGKYDDCIVATIQLAYIELDTLITGWWFKPLWKILVSWDYEIPNIWKVIKFHGSKPPTRSVLLNTLIVMWITMRFFNGNSRILKWSFCTI